VSAVIAEVDRPAVAAAGGVRYDALIAGLCLVFQAGAYLDVWAHAHRPELETFFTPWHAVLYSGFFAVAVATAAPLVLRRRAPGAPWSAALPAGYDLSAIGVLVFFLGGMLDMLWHVVFGIEVGVEALLSPSHLVLAIGATLLLTGPLRAAWRRHEASAPWPAVLSLAFLLSSLMFWTQYAHHLGRPWPAMDFRPVAAEFPLIAPDLLFRNAQPNQSIYMAHALGVASILLQAGLLAAVVLLAVRRWGPALPAGAFTVVLGLAALMFGFARDQLIQVPGAIVAGAVADVLLRRLKPSAARSAALRTFAFAVPFVYFALFFATLALTGGVWWAVSLWSGSIILAGMIGWLLSWLVVPAAVPALPGRH